MECQEETQKRLTKISQFKRRKGEEFHFRDWKLSGFLIKMGDIPAQVLFRVVQGPVGPAAPCLQCLCSTSPLFCRNCAIPMDREVGFEIRAIIQLADAIGDLKGRSVVR